MFTPERILIPVDFLHRESKLIQYAHTLLPKDGGSVHLLHVRGSIPPSAASEAEKRAAMESKITKMDALTETAKSLGLECEAKFESGSVTDTILDVAKRINADCILMAPRGVTAVNRVIIKSTYHSLLQTSPIPVLAVTPRSEIAQEDAPDIRKPKMVLCPVEASDHSLDAIPLAARFAAQHGAQLVAFNVYLDADEAQRVESAAIERIENVFDGDPPIRVSFERVKSASVTRTIRSAIERLHADLVVTATNGRSMLGQAMRPSVTESLTSFSTCPVLTFRPDLMNVNAST